MKTPKPVRMKSGNWRIQIQIDGQRKSITAATKEEVRQLAKEAYAGAQLEKRVPLTVGKAMDRYISEKTGTLSPSTIRGYMSIRRNYFQGLMNLNITDLTQSDIQRAVSEESKKGKSPKTIRNAHGFLNSVLDEFRPAMSLKTRLPSKEKTETRVFTEDEMKQVWKAAKGDTYELPILLASWFGLRMSEILGLKFGDVQDGRIHIHSAVVRGPDGKRVEKKTKTFSGDRWIKLPDEVDCLIRAQRERLAPKSEDRDYICPYADITIYKNFIRICEKANVEPCRFHDLRHFAASEALALGIPDKYSAKRMGHKTDNMLKNVYQHTQKAKEDEFANAIDSKMSELYTSAL